MKLFSKLFLTAFLITASLNAFHNAADASPRWTVAQAKAWSNAMPWLVGSNFIPQSADNQLEMWQAATFDLKEIDFELGLAEALGMTTMRVFLHDLAWSEDPAGFIQRLNAFLTVASLHHIRPMLVLFDSCWDPNPRVGPQLPPRPGVHNSRWVQSPGVAALENPAEYPRLENYTRSIIGLFARDSRILAWDLWNEPDNTNVGSYNDPSNKVNYVLALLPQVFAWARSVNPVQPLTSGVWYGDWSSNASLRPIERLQLNLSDIISFHNYGVPADFQNRLKNLQQTGRPVVCTEYMARPLGSTFQGILPIAKQNQVGAINWGFVAGRTQTFIPWDSWTTPYTSEPPLWFHDIFWGNGTPYLPAETNFIRLLTSGK